MSWEHCPHYELGPADREGIAICQQCGSAVQLRLAGLPLEDFWDQQSTVVSKEGDDVPFNWPGEG